MRAHFGLPSVEAEDMEGKPPIKVKFEIPYFTTSGIQVVKKEFRDLNVWSNKLQVRYLKIIEKSGYQALPWVRYITQNGDYQLRTNWKIQWTCFITIRQSFRSFVITIYSMAENIIGIKCIVWWVPVPMVLIL